MLFVAYKIALFIKNKAHCSSQCIRQVFAKTVSQEYKLLKFLQKEIWHYYKPGLSKGVFSLIL